MASQHARHLPLMYDPAQNNKQVLFNDVSILLRDTEVGSRAVEVDGVGS